MERKSTIDVGPIIAQADTKHLEATLNQLADMTVKVTNPTINRVLREATGIISNELMARYENAKMDRLIAERYEVLKALAKYAPEGVESAESDLELEGTVVTLTPDAPYKSMREDLALVGYRARYVAPTNELIVWKRNS